ncbi:unnamed protein product [Phytophthora fragariaefolia]|uniref:Unnamed protein product n=1 Tax=Phytophthora fragariaefolia TaxID=1490495 RepID=A0A9W7D6M8_9STRA|nr:unnamed protein product [Phytophthora fragariaefolia]
MKLPPPDIGDCCRAKGGVKDDSRTHAVLSTAAEAKSSKEGIDRATQTKANSGDTEGAEEEDNSKECSQLIEPNDAQPHQESDQESVFDVSDPGVELLGATSPPGGCGELPANRSRYNLRKIPNNITVIAVKQQTRDDTKPITILYPLLKEAVASIKDDIPA